MNDVVEEENNLGNDDLPSGWQWKLIKEVGNVQLGRQRAPRYHFGPNLHPYLRVQNIFEDKIELSDVMEMDFAPEDFEKYQLKYGDILLNEGQSPELLGRPAMYRDELPGVCFTNTLIRFRAFEMVNRDFALLVFRHYMHNGRFTQEGKITTNIAHLSATRFSNIEFPLPPLDEQQAIVERAHSLLELADHFENRYDRCLSQVNQLVPEILSQAFRGKLVAQNPNDEPASILLERIRREKKLQIIPSQKNSAQRKPKMPKLSKKLILEVIEQLPDDYFSFDELRNMLPGSYDAIKDMLFVLLEEETVKIQQIFDQESKELNFLRGH